MFFTFIFSNVIIKPIRIHLTNYIAITEGDKKMEETDYRRDVLKNDIKKETQTISRLLELEIDYFRKIGIVLNQ